MARWLVDTSAWSRRDVPEVAGELKAILDADGELVLSPPVLLELLRGPQGERVAEERAALVNAMEVLSVDDETFRLAADVMETLACYDAEGHRLPVTDLITAALAHQAGCGVVHCDGDYEQIAEHGNLNFEHHRIAIPTARGEHPVAGRQRALKRELFQVVHQMEVADAEAFLEKAVDDAHAATR
ncbi:MAG TPA: PIN domain-containing protein [Solirubrobacteraceae bacterium]|nr:PIN domain-containing protein [Solirubrobacteraceae bacterium]